MMTATVETTARTMTTEVSMAKTASSPIEGTDPRTTEHDDP
jgi:hypothetical protein